MIAEFYLMRYWDDDQQKTANYNEILQQCIVKYRETRPDNPIPLLQVQGKIRTRRNHGLGYLQNTINTLATAHEKVVGLPGLKPQKALLAYAVEVHLSRRLTTARLNPVPFPVEVRELASTFKGYPLDFRRRLVAMLQTAHAATPARRWKAFPAQQ